MGATVKFLVPGIAQYVADLTLASGPVTLSAEGRNQRFASSGRFDLGTLKPGVEDIAIEANDGPQSQWALSIRALPVVLSKVGFDHAVARPGEIVTAAYTLSGEATVSARVTDASGHVVRTPGRKPSNAGHAR